MLSNCLLKVAVHLSTPLLVVKTLAIRKWLHECTDISLSNDNAIFRCFLVVPAGLKTKRLGFSLTSAYRLKAEPANEAS
jgi:hypothetical protein